MTDGRNVEIFQEESHTAPLHIHQMQIFIFSSHSPSTLPSELYLLGSVSSRQLGLDEKQHKRDLRSM